MSYDDEPPTLVFGVPLPLVAKAMMFAADWADGGQPFECRSHNKTIRFSQAEIRMLRAAPIGTAS